MAEGDKEGWGGKKGMRWVRRKGERGRIHAFLFALL